MRKMILSATGRQILKIVEGFMPNLYDDGAKVLVIAPLAMDIWFIMTLAMAKITYLNSSL